MYSFFLSSLDAGGDGLLIYLTVYLLSMVHFFTALTVGLAAGLSPLAALITGLLGMMTTLSVFLFGGPPFVRWFLAHLPPRWQQKMQARQQSPRMARIKKYGTLGVTFSIPIILNPILGGILHNTLGSPVMRTWLLSWLGCLFWATIVTLSVYYSIELVF